MMQGSLAEKLRVLRARMGLSLTEAAARAGVTRDTLSDIEHGKRQPYMPTLAKIATGYGVPVEDLLEEPALAGKAEAPPETGQSEEVVRDLAEVAQEVLPLIDEIYEQERNRRAQLDASEGIPQTSVVRAESKIVDLFSDLHPDAAPQVLAMVGLYYRRKVAQLEEENAQPRAAARKTTDPATAAAITREIFTREWRENRPPPHLLRQLEDAEEQFIDVGTQIWETMEEADAEHPVPSDELSARREAKREELRQQLRGGPVGAKAN